MFGFLKNVSRGPAANMANIAVPPTPQNVMTGPVEYKVYVYDNRPLLRIPPGHRFLTGIVRQRAILTSVLTDTEYDTADGGYALAYNGAIFPAPPPIRLGGNKPLGFTKVRLNGFLLLLR